MTVVHAFIVCIALLPIICNGQLQFEKTVLHGAPKEGADRFVVEFPFTNISNKKVTILDLKSSCPCLGYEVTKKEVAAGEAGTIRTTFVTKGLQGKLRKEFYVQFENGKEPIKLVVTTELPVYVSLVPWRVEWDVDEDLRPRKISFTLEKAKSIEVKLPKKSPDWSVEVKGDHLLVQPKSSKMPKSKWFKVPVVCDGKNEFYLNFVAKVKKRDGTSK